MVVGLRRLTISMACAGTMLVAGVLVALGGADTLVLLPALVAFWPLLCDRYFGEAQLARLVVRLQRRPPRRRRSVPALQSVRPCAVRLARGGRLLGRSLAVRPPPAVVASS